MGDRRPVEGSAGVEWGRRVSEVREALGAIQRLIQTAPFRETDEQTAAHYRVAANDLEELTDAHTLYWADHGKLWEAIRSLRAPIAQPKAAHALIGRVMRAMIERERDAETWAPTLPPEDLRGWEDVL